MTFGQGPGSFMGVRLATTVAQGLAYSIDCPVVAISTLRILAQTAYQQLGFEKALVGWDARMQEFYWGAYLLNNQGIMQSIQADALISPVDFKLAPDIQEWPAVGNAWSTYNVNVCSHELFPEAPALIILAVNDFNEGKALPAIDAKPIYLRGFV